MNKLKLINSVFLSVMFNLYGTAATHASNSSLERITVYTPHSGRETTEIVSIQKNTKRIALSCSSEGIIEIISIENPSEPKVISVNGVDPKAGIEGQYAPEGLAYFKNDYRHFIFSANEKEWHYDSDGS